MEIHQATYLQSAQKMVDLPKPLLPEYAFTGRSNAGKSSLINMLCNRNKLAITSSKPGRTQAINHFLINESWYLVDLPGYGFAKVSKKSREQWIKMIRRYLRERTNLVSVFAMVDIRVKPMESDLEYIQMLGENNIPFQIVFTKTDQLKQREVAARIKSYQEILLESWEELPGMIISSAKKGRGRNEILEYIDENNRVFIDNLDLSKKG